MLGVVETPNVPTFTRTLPGTPTLADRIKGMVTDVMLNNFEPNAIVIHHLDWEEVQLTKTSTGAYLGDIFPVNAPQPVLWGVPVVVTHAAQSYRDGLSTSARVVIVGDFQRATLWDRSQATVEIGFKDDDLIRNKRTVLGEQRVAFAVRAPAAFTMYETEAPSAS
jgi:HK97 family phage major capsid protein